MAVQPPGPPSKPGAAGILDPRAQEELRRQDRRRQEWVADACGELEESLERLRARYDLFFIGVERREPSRERDEMKRSVARIKSETGLNTGLRFRIDTLHARFVAYERMWMRSAREKEEGTYRRDLMRLRRRAGKPEATPEGPKEAPAAPLPASEPTPARPVVERASADRPTTTLAETPKEAAPAAPAAISRSAGGLSPAQLQALYAAYVEAKRRCNEDVSRISYDALAKTVAKQVPELLARYKAKSVEFKVLIKDGKAVLKAVPRT